MNEREQALVDAERELRRAGEYLNVLKNTRSFSTFDDAWRDFLSSIDRCYNRIEVFQNDSGKVGPRVGQIVNARKKDPLIKYMKEARNTHEHRPYKLLNKTGPGVSIGLAPGQTYGYIDYLRIDSTGDETVIESSDKNFGMSVIITPKDYELLPVMDRDGNSISVPTTHLGKKISIVTPVRAAEITLKFYKDKFEEVRIEVGKINAGVSY